VARLDKFLSFNYKTIFAIVGEKKKRLKKLYGILKCVIKKWRCTADLIYKLV